MLTRRATTLLTTLLALSVLGMGTLPLTAGSGPGIFIYGISTPTINPDPVHSGGWTDISFTIFIHNQDDCRQVYVHEHVPACAYVLAWRISLDGEWLREGSTRLAEGHAPYSPQLEPYPDTYLHVTERVRVHAEPGEHDVHVTASWIAGVPISRYDGVGKEPFDHATPCGVRDHIHEYYRNWDCHTGQRAPVVPLRVQPPIELVPGLN